jgi:hypothetical protein
MQQLEKFLFTLQGLVAPIATPVGNAVKNVATTVSKQVSGIVGFFFTSLKGMFETVVGFVAFFFQQLDDTLVTPIFMTACSGVTMASNGVLYGYNVTTNFAHSTIAKVNDNVVLPVTNTIGNKLIKPIYLRVASVAQCSTKFAIQTGAMIDNHLSLVALMQGVIEKSKKVDQCMTSGLVTKKVVLPAIEKVKNLDEKLICGMGQDFVFHTIDEFQAAKGGSSNSSKHEKVPAKAPTTNGRVVPANNTMGEIAPNTLLTSAGAPVFERKAEF